ncbi:ferrous iron transport protein B [Ruminococcaceae bacterium OttesenSCG-928-A16]|nr:ferrous iron transport protein B [Ruminococcaceae bacterium OttesenSCG-928-A16]
MSITIALAGNPNSGKTTMFNNLTGATQYVGNWPGVTVEKKAGTLRGNKNITVIDLPGVYSLSPYTPEEIVTRDYLLHESPGAILNLVDGTNLERNLYLTTQILEIGLPVVVALNMADILRKTGDVVDINKLSEQLGCPVVATSAIKGEGIIAAAELAAKNAGQKTFMASHRYANDIEAALAEIDGIIAGKVPANQQRWYSIKLFERDEKALQELALPTAKTGQISRIIETIENEYDDDSESIITSERYTFIAGVMKQAVHKKQHGLTTSDKIDRVVTNRWLALPIFAVIMLAVYYISVSTVGTIVTDFTNETLFGEWIMPSLASWLTGLGTAEWLVSLVVDGIVGGVGAVLGFVPQMVVLFLLLGFLEDCGYMARVAFIMDRIFRKFGLSGKSFIPMLISSGCGVPGIMATKTIENEKDRRMTIITTTFIPCGAKLPIIALIAGAILGGAWWMAPLMYFIGVAAVLVSGIILKKTKLFAGEASPFVMELPQYHWPALKGLLLHMWERVRSFIVKAGTVIFASAVLIWFLASFGFNGGFGMVEAENSILAVIGRFIAPIFAPLGFADWRAAVGTISGLVAKENLVSTLGVLYGLGEEAEGLGLWQATMAMFPNIAGAMSFLIFNMLCAPCFAAIGAIKRQMASTKWTLFAVAYQTVFAYVISLMVYQFGSLLTGGAFGVGTGVAVVLLAVFLFLLLRPAQNPLNKAAMQH